MLRKSLRISSLCVAQLLTSLCTQSNRPNSLRCKDNLYVGFLCLPPCGWSPWVLPLVCAVCPFFQMFLLMYVPTSLTHSGKRSPCEVLHLQVTQKEWADQHSPQWKQCLYWMCVCCAEGAKRNEGDAGRMSALPKEERRWGCWPAFMSWIKLTDDVGQVSIQEALFRKGFHRNIWNITYPTKSKTMQHYTMSAFFWHFLTSTSHYHLPFYQ